MTLYPNICFVGQGPSKGQFVKLKKHYGPMWAEKECERLALLGRVGDRLSSMVGMTTAEYAIAFRRENLNSKWVGKNGKGDNFDATRGRVRALDLLNEFRITKYVLLGSNVARCFTLRNFEWLDVFERGDKSFLFLPHPSGINIWYNSKRNRNDASKALNSFIHGRN